MSRRWTADEIPDQGGRLAIVTGANSGLGRITALELARHGAQEFLQSGQPQQPFAEFIRSAADLGGRGQRVRPI
jgi:NAD(P)-dependent dehydrogenase (short-subunit alcohol dehydrogenase family)